MKTHKQVTIAGRLQKIGAIGDNKKPIHPEIYWSNIPSHTQSGSNAIMSSKSQAQNNHTRHENNFDYRPNALMNTKMIT